MARKRKTDNNITADTNKINEIEGKAVFDSAVPYDYHEEVIDSDSVVVVESNASSDIGTGIEIFDPEIDRMKKKTIAKSNALISAKYKMSLLGNQILAISLTNLECEPGSKQVKSSISPQTIRKILNREDDENIYRKLKDLSHTITGNVITIEDGKGNFRTFNLVTNADYESGSFNLTWNKELTPHITELNDHFTKLELGVMLSFSKATTLRLYELLKKDIYLLAKSGRKYLSIIYGVNELKAAIGLINTDAPYLAVHVGKDHPDWDHIVEDICKKEDVQYRRFDSFKSHVLEPARKEMAEIADIKFDYSLDKKARGKVVGIKFIVSLNNPDIEIKRSIHEKAEKIKQIKPNADSSGEEIMKMDDLISDDVRERSSELLKQYSDLKAYLTEHRKTAVRSFTIEYFESLLEDAGNDVKVIKKAIDLSLETPKIRNYCAWLREAVRNNYAAGTSEPTQEITLSEQEFVSMWQKCKQKAKYKEFLELYDMSEAEFEMLYTPKERVKRFYDFKVGRTGADL